MNRWLAVAVAVSLSSFASGCGDSTPACTPGESAQCFCPDATGAQTCGSDGTFGPCECGDNSSANNTTPNNTTNGDPNNVTPNNTTNGDPNNMTSNNTTSNNNMTSNNTTTSTNNNSTAANNTTGPTYCKQSCTAAADCAVFGDPAVWECVDSACEQVACTTDDGCFVRMSNFKPGCNSSAQCDFGFTCATVNGENYCAFEPLAGFFECDQIQLEPITATSVDNGEDKTICAAPGAMCEQSSGNCFRGCATDADCRPAGMMVGLVCMANGQCGCTEDAHCTISGNVCIEGECGCSSQAVCDTISNMAGVAFVCVP